MPSNYGPVAVNVNTGALEYAVGDGAPVTSGQTADTGIGAAAVTGNQLTVQGSGATEKSLVVKQSAGGTAVPFQVQASDGTVYLSADLSNDILTVGQYVRLGGSGPYVKRESNSLVAAVSPSLAYIGFYAATFILAPAVAINHSANGALSILISAGGLCRVNLTANVTASTIGSPLTDGHLIIVEMRQDATGGRTYVLPTNVRWVGGSAPSNTTLNTMTRFELCYDAPTGLWVENWRATAVPLT